MNKREELITLARRCSEILKNKYHVQSAFLIGSLVKGYFHVKMEDSCMAKENLKKEISSKEENRLDTKTF